MKTKQKTRLNQANGEIRDFLFAKDTDLSVKNLFSLSEMRLSACRDENLSLTSN